MAAPFLIKAVGSVVVMAALAACQRAVAEHKLRPLATLVGTEWGFADSQRFVAFKANGEVVGSGGCNTFFGSFEQDGRRLTFGTLASTRKACPPAVMDGERDFLALLDKVRAAEANRMVLTLFAEDGSVLAELRRKDWD